MSMDERRVVKISKYLAKHLRHRPERIGPTLSPEGWADVPNCSPPLHGTASLSPAPNWSTWWRRTTKRYELDGDRIRAVQGHSIPVELNLPAQAPPEFLYHGTVRRSVDAILREGLLPMGTRRPPSPDLETALRVGARRGLPVVLTVGSGRMAADGHEFRVSANGVWLADSVPPEYLRE